MSFVETARSQFPALTSGYIFADNAGGSQCAKGVVDRISDYLLNTNVQLGADYSVSVQSTSRVAEGSVTAAKLFNASSPDEIAFASSSTMAAENLARALETDVMDGEEIIITGEHEGTSSPLKYVLDLTRYPQRTRVRGRNWPSASLVSRSKSGTLGQRSLTTHTLSSSTSRTSFL